MSPEANRNFVTDHDTFGYFADRYGLHVAGMLVPKDSTANTNPTAKQIAAVTNAIKASKAKAILSGQGVDSKTADQIAKGNRRASCYGTLYQFAQPADGPAPTFLEMLEYNAETILNALR